MDEMWVLYDKINEIIDFLNEEREELREEIKVDAQLLKERQKLLDIMPRCSSHGECIPYAIDWVKKESEKKYTKQDMIDFATFPSNL